MPVYLETTKNPLPPRSCPRVCQYTGISRRRWRNTSCGKPDAKVSGSARFTPRSDAGIVTSPNERLGPFTRSVRSGKGGGFSAGTGDRGGPAERSPERDGHASLRARRVEQYLPPIKDHKT